MSGPYTEPARSITRALAKSLTAAGLADYREAAAGGDTFAAPLPPEPDTALGMVATGGNPTPAADRLAYDEPTVQLTFRAAVGAEAEAEAWASRVYAHLQGWDGTLDAGGPDEFRVVSCSSLQSAPAFIGRDEAGRSRYVLNFALHVRATDDRE